MTLSSRTQRRLLTWLAFVAAGAIVGEIYASTVVMPNKPWLKPGCRAHALEP